MTDFKQLCAELLAALEEEASNWNLAPECHPLVVRAQTALAEPEPQRRCIYSPVQIAECGGPCQQGPEHCDCGELWVTEPEDPTDEEIMELMPQQMRDDLAAANAVLTAVTLTKYDVPPEGLPAFAEEMAPLIAAALRAAADQAAPEKQLEDIAYIHESYVDGMRDALACIEIIADELEAQSQAH